MKKRIGLPLALSVLSLISPTARPAQADVLPEPRPAPFQGRLGLTPADSQPAAIQGVSAGKDTPNILLIMTDDVGFGASSVFGGPVETPAFEALAANGVRYNQFHTTALCSPTRAALLTGRNHHSAHTGLVVDVRSGYPGYNALIDRDTATIAEVLKQNGYATAWFGKNHNVPLNESSAAGPFDRWPNNMGFEYFYGFLAGATNQYSPIVFENTRPVEPAVGLSDYHFNDDLRDRAVSWLRDQKTIAPDKPVFMYYAPGATHAPHHVPDEWTRPYKGRFDQGWDVLRREIYERQKKLGVIPPTAALAPMSPGIPAWESLPENKRKLHSRMMEVYAGYLTQTDQAIGELIAAFRELGLAENTIIIYIQGDNGASAEARMGTVNEIVGLINGLPEDFEPSEEMLQAMGGPAYLSNYAAGWATALCSPFQWSKEIASHYGGTRNGMVISWPARFAAQNGGLRSQWHHVVDIHPTLLEAAGLTAPTMVNGVAQKPLEGISLLYSLDNPDAPDRHTEQYFEILGNLAYYRDGWVAATAPRLAPWREPLSKLGLSPAEWEWELYHVAEDFSQSKNLAAENPLKLKEMQMLFWAEAGRRNVLPVNDNVAAATGAPQGQERTVIRFHQGFRRLPEGAAPVLRNRSYNIKAEVEIKDGPGAEGMIFTLGGQFGGLALFMERGRPVFVYNYLALNRLELQGKEALAAGKHLIELDFEYDGGGKGRGGTYDLRVDSRSVARGRLEKTVPRGFSMGDTLDVGLDTGTPIEMGRYELPFEFNSRIDGVSVTLK
ncbi:arylsulfatase [Desulfovibrio sp. OttesenSCG-928-A18]|nr:arylsulfatase [Desulfovibrio sp. OttesenSCG-928-A18]